MANIPPLSSSIPAVILKPLQAIKQALSGMVTPSDLVNAGIATTNSSGRLSAKAVTPTYAIPTVITGLTATGAFATIILEWNDPSSQVGFAYTNIYRASVDDVGQAVLIGSSAAPIFSDTPPNSSMTVTYYYWVRGVNKAGIEGGYNQTAGTPTSTATDPTYAMQIMSSHPWVALTSYMAWNYASPTIANGFRYKVVTGGKSGATEPTWPVTLGSTVADGQVIWETVAANAAVPFAIDPVTNDIYMDVAFIRDAAITSAKIKNLAVDSAKIANGAITTAKIGAAQITSTNIGIAQVNDAHITTLSAGKISAGTINTAIELTSPIIRSGQTAYNTGRGFWLGSAGGTPKLSVGDPAGQSITWDGATLNIKGDIIKNIAYDTVTPYFIAPESSKTINIAYPTTYYEVRAVQVWDQGSVAVKASTVSIATNGAMDCNISIRKNGIEVANSYKNAPTAWESPWTNISVAAGDIISMWFRAGGYSGIMTGTLALYATPLDNVTKITL